MSTVAREKGAIFCPVHPKKKLAFLCKQCNILICNKCFTKEHSGHPVEEVKEVVEKKFRKLDEFICNTEGSTIPRTKKDFKQVEAHVSARGKELEAGIEKAYQHEKYLIELVQKNTKKTVSELKGELQTINQQLSQFKSESDTYLDDLKSAIKECKETKKTKNDILIIDVVNSVDTLSNNPPTCQFPQTRKKFTPGANPNVDIEKAFGCVSTDGEASVGIQYNKDKPKLVQPRPSSHANIQDLHSIGAAAATKKKQLLSQHQVTQCKDVKSEYPQSIVKFSDGTLCYCCNGEPYVYLINKSGDIKTIKLDVNIHDIAIHPTTDVLYSVCVSDNSIRTVDIHTGTTSVVFNTVDPPYCMAFTVDGTILVGFYVKDKVVNYTLRGEVLRSVNVKDPWHISVCDITGNIVIAACDSGTQVMNKNLQNVFTYKGPTEKKQSKEELYCFDAVFDSEGHVLVGDCWNKEVHVVDANTGKHLSTINSDKFGGIRSLCVDQNGGLIVGTCDPYRLVKISKDKPKPVHDVKTQDLHSKGAAATTKNKQLLSKPKVTWCKDVQSSYPQSIEKFSDGTLCYCCYNESNVYLIDKSGDIKEVKLDVGVRDIAIHPTTDVLYSVCYSYNSIRTVDIHTGTTSVVFTTVGPPWCIAFTADGTILVGFYMNKKIVNYTLRGEVLRSVNVDDPRHISVSDITGNIVIAACSSGTQVMNKDFQTVFTYKGPTEKKQSKEELNCEDAVFDSEGHILVGDCYNKEVHVVDANTGKHLSTINSDKFGNIESLGIDQDGGLVVGTRSPDKLVFV